MANLLIHESGEDSENRAVDRWLDVGGRIGELMRLGLPSPWWWCAIRLPRAQVFDMALDGDVDIIAGTLERIDGVVQWPPRIDWLLACEAKSTVFEAALDKARRTQMGGRRRRIKGNLKKLSQLGVERVAFLHLSGTNPRQGTGGFAWMVAFDDAARGREVVGPVFRPGELPPHVGHYSTVIGALPDVDGMVRKLEHAAGGGGLLEIRQPCAPNPAAAWQPYRDQFRARLGRVPVPQYSPVFIKACLVCNTWGRFYSAVEECFHHADLGKAP